MSGISIEELKQRHNWPYVDFLVANVVFPDAKKVYFSREGPNGEILPAIECRVVQTVGENGPVEERSFQPTVNAADCLHATQNVYVCPPDVFNDQQFEVFIKGGVKVFCDREILARSLAVLHKHFGPIVPLSAMPFMPGGDKKFEPRQARYYDAML